jgi:hypothetical protein
MALNLLLDEQISPVIAEQVMRHRPGRSVQSVHRWGDGAFLGASDRELLHACSDQGLTLVTYDLKTVPIALSEFGAKGLLHGGAVLIDNRSVPNNAFGPLTRSIVRFLDAFGDSDGRGCVYFLTAP